MYLVVCVHSLTIGYRWQYHDEQRQQEERERDVNFRKDVFKHKTASGLAIMHASSNVAFENLKIHTTNEIVTPSEKLRNSNVLHHFYRLLDFSISITYYNYLLIINYLFNIPLVMWLFHLSRETFFTNLFKLPIHMGGYSHSFCLDIIMFFLCNLYQRILFPSALFYHSSSNLCPKQLLSHQ